MSKKYVTPSKLSVFLDNLKNTFALITHKHTLSDVLDYKVDTALSPTSTNPVQNKVLDAEFDAISDAMGALESVIDSKSDSTHTHTVATTSANGFMSSTDKTKLDSIEDNATAVGKNVGNNGEIFNDYSGNTAGQYAHAEGRKTTASGKYSHSEGNATIASGESSHSEGAGTLSETLSRGISGTTYTYDLSIEGKASALASHSEGAGTQATNKYAHSEGRGTIASGVASHAEGTFGYETSVTDGVCTWAITPTTASGMGSHAEGCGTKASASYAHAEGRSTVASSEAAHAEGIDTTASSWYAHAEGEGSAASGRASHSEGGNTVAKGQYSHTEGFGTLASSNHQHVQGKYNIEDTATTYAHIVGNGSSSKRSNAHTLDWNGNAWFSGDVYVGGVSQIDGSSKLVTKYELDNLALITVDDIDTICGQKIYVSSEVEF